jgi:hypothetical protein
LTKPNRRQTSAGTSGSRRPAANPTAGGTPVIATASAVAAPQAADRPGSRPVAAGSRRRAGRRETARRHRERGTFLERNRSRLVYAVAGAAIVLVGAWIFLGNSAPTYACSNLFSPDEAAPSGHLGAIQPDLGNRHAPVGDKVTYTLCPPASGTHYNSGTFGPIPPGFYGPNDRSQPQGWVHNLEHGGLVVVYSCTQGACDPGDLDAMRAMFRTWNDMQSAVCKVPASNLGVVARLDEMPKPYAALLWDRVLYMDTLDPALIRRFYEQEGEILSEDQQEFVVPPERRCDPPPTPAPSTSPSASPAGSVSPSPSASGSIAPSASPSSSPSASPSASASPSPSAS